jgi:hypothetical protein
MASFPPKNIIDIYETKGELGMLTRHQMMENVQQSLINVNRHIDDQTSNDGNA